jgi:hypothetical protein
LKDFVLKLVIMGCTISDRSPQPLENTFKVFNIDDAGHNRYPGQLQVTSQSLVLLQRGKDPIGWPLRGLRRYGFQDDLFTFESGRRCPTGSGIFAFRCHRAEQLFDLLQQYVALAGQSNPQQPTTIPRNLQNGILLRHTANFNAFQPASNRQVYPNGRIPLSEYRNTSAVGRNVIVPSDGPPVTLASLPDILAMSRHVHVDDDDDAHVQYADLDHTTRVTDGRDIICDMNSQHSNRKFYVNVSQSGEPQAASSNHSYANFVLLSPNVSRVNYTQLDFSTSDGDGLDAAGGQSPMTSPKSLASFRSESPCCHTESYTTIDVDRTAALNSMILNETGVKRSRGKEAA